MAFVPAQLVGRSGCVNLFPVVFLAHIIPVAHIKRCLPPLVFSITALSVVLFLEQKKDLVQHVFMC